jgi:hypothetical protein
MTARPFSQQILRLCAGGTPPNPAEFCPANGYVDETKVIPNPFLPENGWNLLCTFQNNSPFTTTFDPIITAITGQYGWDLGDGSTLVGEKGISHTYLTTATRTVKLFGKGTCNITGIEMNGDDLIGILDLSNDAFKSLTSIYLSSNPLMTGVTFPSSITGTVSYLSMYSTGITGNLDLTKFTTFSSTALIYLSSNPSMTGVTFANSITGTISYLSIYSTGITGNLNLTKFTAFSLDAKIYLSSNPSMTSVTFANFITGTISTLQIYLTGITGNLDLTKFTTFSTNASIYLYSNPLMTSVTFANSITGTIILLQIDSTGITGNLDLTQFTTFGPAAFLLLNSNPSMTGVTFASSITGIIKTLRIDSNPNLAYVDFSKLVTAVASLSWQMQNNNWSAAIVNQVLSIINSISATGFTGRVINIGGSNVDPDSTSGGFDGVAARTALQAKSFTVTII